VGGYILETIEVIKNYMAVLRHILDTKELSDDEFNAIEFAHELAIEEFYAFIQREQETLNDLKARGMLN
jgi:hypothetical protein